MSQWLRRAGRASLDDDSRLVWTAADGTRGRRWRASLADASGVGLALLLEVGLDRRATRLEVVTAAGLLTLHPDHDGSRLHGNVVTPDGVRHVELPWGPRQHLDVAGCPVTVAVIAHAFGAEVSVGASIDIRVVTVGRSLEPTTARARLDRTSPRSWLLEVDGRSVSIDVDEDGLPRLDGEMTWPLER